MTRSICIRCAGEKELPLSRCASCGHTPDTREAPLSILASTRMLDDAELDAVALRIRRGEALRPTAARLAAARALLSDVQPASHRMGRWELAGLTALALVVTPLCALAAAWAWREAPSGRQALAIGAVGLVVDAALTVRTWLG